MVLAERAGGWVSGCVGRAEICRFKEGARFGLRGAEECHAESGPEYAGIYRFVEGADPVGHNQPRSHPACGTSTQRNASG